MRLIWALCVGEVPAMENASGAVAGFDCEQVQATDVIPLSKTIQSV